MDTAFVASASAIFVACLGGLAGLVGHAFNRIRDVETLSAERIKEVEERSAQRIRDLEDDLQALTIDNHYHWLWARSLVDYGYKYRRQGAPDPPTLEDTKQRRQREQS